MLVHLVPLYGPAIRKAGNTRRIRADDLVAWKGDLLAGGIVLQRFGVNALDVIKNVKKRFQEIASSLPESLEIVPVYDRSNLIYAAINTLKHTLFRRRRRRDGGCRRCPRLHCRCRALAAPDGCLS